MMATVADCHGRKWNGLGQMIQDMTDSHARDCDVIRIIRTEQHSLRVHG